MKYLLAILILAMMPGYVGAESPQTVINDMIEKYPVMERTIWYFFDVHGSREYMSLKMRQQRGDMSPTDVERLRKTYLDLWANTDFTKAQGAQFIGPDTISLTLNGNHAAVFDLGSSTVSANYAFNAAAKKQGQKPDFTQLLKVFEKTKSRRRVSTTQVRYTGFKRGMTFVFQRGGGRGWTQGERTTVYGASMTDFQNLRAAIRRFIGSKVPVTVFDRTWEVLVKSESTPDFFALGYDSTTKQLSFLHATVEDEICVPLGWQTIDYLTNNEVKHKH